MTIIREAQEQTLVYIVTPWLDKERKMWPVRANRSDGGEAQTALVYFSRILVTVRFQMKHHVHLPHSENCLRVS